ARAPVLVTARREGYSFTEPGDEPSISWIRNPMTGRIVKKDMPRLFFTGDDGSLRLPFSEHLYDLVLLHPLYYLDPFAGGRRLADLGPLVPGRVTLSLPVDGGLRLVAFSGPIEKHVLLDLDGAPIKSSAVEVVLEGMPPVRLFADAYGWFRVGFWLFPPGEAPLSFSRPGAGGLPLWPPGFFRGGVGWASPSRGRVVVVKGRPPGRLFFRTVGGAALEPEP